MKAYSYIRMSNETQLRGNSLARQIGMARDYAAQHGWELVEDIYQDLGQSAYRGRNAQTGKLGAFISALETGQIPKDSILIVESLDRLSRQSPTKAFTQLMNLLEHGIEIHTLFDRQVYTKRTLDEPGLLFSSIGHMLRAHSESDTKSQRLKKSWENKRQLIDKKILTSTCPKWLQPVPDKSGFAIIPDRVKTIKTIFDLCIDQNLGVYTITRHLNANPLKYPSFSTPTKKNRRVGMSPGWHMSYIQKILNNPAVHGQFQPSIFETGIRTKGLVIHSDYYPAVITSDRYLLAQAKIEKRSLAKGGRKGEAFNNIFSKLLRCGHCSGTIRVINKGPPPKGGKYLQCSKSLDRRGCEAMPWRYETFEDDFLKHVSEIRLEEVFSKNNQKSEFARLNEELELNIVKKDKAQIAITNLVSSLADLSVGAQKHITTSLEIKNNELDLLMKTEVNLRTELLELEKISPKEVQKDLIEFLKIRRTNKTAIDVERRRRLNKSLTELLFDIQIYPFSGDFLAPDILPNVDNRIMKKLKNEGFDTEKKIEDLFLQKNGKSIYNKMARYFVLKFRNGEEKIVHPYIDLTKKAKSDEDRLSTSWKIQKQIKKSKVRGNI